MPVLHLRDSVGFHICSTGAPALPNLIASIRSSCRDALARIGMFEDPSKSLIKTKQPQATCLMFLFQHQTNTYGKKMRLVCFLWRLGRQVLLRTFFISNSKCSHLGATWLSGLVEVMETSQAPHILVLRKQSPFLSLSLKAKQLRPLSH